MKKLVKINGKFCILESELVCSGNPAVIGKMENSVGDITQPARFIVNKEVETTYFRNGKYNPAASYRREQEIKSKVNNGAFQKIPLTTMHRGQNKTIIPNKDMAKAAVQTLKFSSILIDKIAKEKHLI